MPPAPPELLLTCEHASDFIPAALRALLKASPHRGTHRAYDLGAEAVAKVLSRQLGAPLFLGRINRLLVDMNRSAHNASVLSPSAQRLPVAQQAALLSRYHAPHWARVRQHVEASLRKHRQVVHIAVHSFTPVLQHDDGRLDVRTADVGLLYDPGRPGERALAGHWIRTLREAGPKLRLRRNYPYLGKGDGLTTALRKEFKPSRYVGFELEMNQALLHPTLQKHLVAALVASLTALGFGLGGDPTRP